MTKQQIIDEQRQEIQALRRNIADLTYRQNFAVTELSELSQGLGIKPSWYDTGRHSWDTAMQNKAALAVARIAKMPLREAP